MRQGRVFVGQTDTVIKHAVARREAVSRWHHRAIDKVAKGDARLHQLRVVGDLVGGDAEEVTLLVRRPFVAAKEGP